MDAYDIFDRQHEQHPDDRDEAERWEWIATHNCPKDTLIVVPWEGGQDFHAGCTECYFKYWTHEGARITTNIAQAA